MHFHIERNNQSHGPYDINVLKKYVEDGLILLQDKTGLDIINKCLENTGTNPKLVLRQHKVNKNDDSADLVSII